jgi:WD40 repeat protein/serine/threonine protein kinase
MLGWPAQRERVWEEAMEYRALGPLAAVVDGRERSLGGPRQRLVLAVLLAHANQTVQQDTLIDAVWSGQPPEAARSTLHVYISNLRKELGPEQILRRGDGYRVDVAARSFDVLLFEQLLDEGRQRLAPDPAAARVALVQALELWRGQAYGDVGGAPALAAEALRLTDLRLTAVEHRIDADLATGNHAQVIGELETLTRDNPVRERFRAQQMLALYRSGRQVEALTVFQRTREYLNEELGIDPSSEIRDLHQRILEQNPQLELHTMPDAAPPPTSDAARMARGYELREPLGKGDFGIVHRAYQPSVGREVAVKMIRPEYANHPEFVLRFESEARTVAQLEHPHVVPLFDYWRDPSGAYLVTPLMRGGSLAEALRRGGWNLPPALRLLDQVGDALSYAHRHGVVHRDVKPANVLLDSDGNAYLSDFGIAARQTDDTGAPMTTSLSYVPPEELKGEPHGPASDMFSLGVLTFELLTGHRPPARRPLPSVSAVPGSLPRELDDVLQRATDDQPANRYQRVDDFVRAVRRAVGADVVAAAGPAERQRPAEAIRNPYKGLRAFLETDALDFHGRDPLVDELLQAVRSHPVVALVGPSGSGKSSVVRAGLIPRLRAGGLPSSRAWLVTTMFPGSYPFEELEAALLRVAVESPQGLIDELSSDGRGLLRVTKQILPTDDSRLVLVIDQFEELFSTVASESTRRLFLENLVSVAADQRSRIRIVLTMRADYFHRPLEYSEFAGVLRDGLVTVAPMSAEGLALAIAAPARAVGVEIEPGLVSRVIADVESQPGGLPLLQYALTELFSARADDELTISGYEATGGVLGALGRRAEALYTELSPTAQETARQLFLRLVTVDEDAAGDTRRRVRRSELSSLAVDQQALDLVINQYGTFRLLSFDSDPVTRGPTVEVAHEALLREWPRLRGWIDEQRDDLLLHRRVNAATREWLESGRDPSFALRGSRLEQAENWQTRTGIALSGEEREYLAASQDLRDAEAAASRRHRRRLLVAVAAGLTALAVAAAVALVQWRSADRDARMAAARELAAASVANLTVDPERSVLLALEATAATRDVDGFVLREAEEALHRAVKSNRLLLTIPQGGMGVSVTPDGSRFAISAFDGTTTVRNTETGDELLTLTGPERDPTVTFSPDNRLIATAHGDGTVRLWDAASGDEIEVMQGPSGAVTHPAFSPDGRWLATAGEEATVRVWNMATGEVTSLVGPEGVTSNPEFSPDGTRLAAVAGTTATVWDLRRGEPTVTLQGHGWPLQGVAFSPDGALLVTASMDGTAILWDAESGTKVETLAAPAPLWAVAFSPDGRRVATGGSDAMARVWDVETGGLLLSLPGHSVGIRDLAFTPDGVRLLTTAFDNTTRVWDVSVAGGRDLFTVPGVEGIFAGVEFSPDGNRFAAPADPSGVTIWDAETGAQVASLGGHEAALTNVAFSPDGTLLAGASDVSSTQPVWDVRTGELLFTLTGHEGTARSIAFSPDGRRLATGGHDSTLRTWDAATGAAKTALPVTAEALDVAFSADGRYLVAGLDDGSVPIWNAGSLEPVRTLATEQGPVEGVTFGPSGRLYTAGTDGSAKIWDPAAGTEVMSLHGHDVVVSQVAVTSDESRAATTSDDGTAKLWDLASGRELLTLYGHDMLVYGAAFSPDDRLLATASPDGTVSVHLLPVDEFTEVARGRVTRPLTAEECQQYLHVDQCPDD